MTGKLTEIQKLELKFSNVRLAVKDILWMARRYANGRKTYAPEMFNDAYDTLRSELGDEVDDNYAMGDKGSKFYDISIATSNKHPYAIYGNGEDDEDDEELKKREFYKRP